ncbi:MAG: hypothetical protein NTV51_20555 [Verrucomicrobia bacterium]|nr:hypothetical protein [Verrucomicrobiota bacterium]
MSLRPLAFALTLVLAATLPGAEPPADANAYAQQLVASHGGAGKLLRVFTFSETYHMGGREKGTDRTSTLSPPGLWYVGNTERVAEEGKGAICHDVWMWTLVPLLHPKTRLEILPAITVDGKEARGLKVAGSIEPAMAVYFDATTDDLLKIEWKGEQFFFSAPVVVDGTRVPSRCVLIGKSGKERMRTELRDIKRLTTLPGKN